MKKVICIFAVVLFTFTVSAQDKKNELGLLLGVEFIPQRTAVNGTSLDFSNSVIFSANYARRLTGHRTALFLEFPFAAAPSHTISSSAKGSIKDLATLYITPSLRANFAHDSRISPWLSGGFGYGLYEGSEFLNDNLKNPERHVSSGTLQFGAGLDVRTGVSILFPISLRGEVRDYYTVASPSFGTRVTGGQHNVVASGGLVLHF